jgi:hypothetical protein
VTAVSAEARYLLTPGAVRDRAETIFRLAGEGRLEHFDVDEARLPDVVGRVTDVTLRRYPDVARIPYHARYRHFDAGGVERLARFEAKLAAKTPEERLAARFELVTTSVLLDAGAGASWSYRGADGGVYARSEGLAVASFEFFEAGGFSGSRTDPLRADADVLEQASPDLLARAFQVSRENPLVGLDGRALVLRRLGEVVRKKPEYFGLPARLGGLGATLASRAEHGALPAARVLEAVLGALGEIWPGRESLGGVPLGDVWPHPAVGLVPFHKLSQWLTYSLVEPLEQAAIRVAGLDALTGLPEYRNGGLFLDGGVIVPKHRQIYTDVHAVSSTVVVEWRALTVALLDRTARAVRERLGLSVEQLPLAKVLQGGTWEAGREIARERRPDGTPPLWVDSDGTVF